MKRTVVLIFLLLSSMAHSQQLLKEWAKNYGGTGGEQGVKLLEAHDGNYMMLSTVGSTDIDVDTTNGAVDVWLVKLNTSGDILWEKAYGGSSAEIAISMCHAHDSGYVILATTTSNDGDVSGYHGGGWEDLWVFKCDLDGNLEWQKCLGGSLGETAGNVKQTFDEGYILCGASNSLDGDINFNIGAGDCWVIKLNQNGDIVWNSTIGGSDWELSVDLTQLYDGSYFMLGQSSSTDGHVTQASAIGNYWLVKLDSLGQYQWDRAYGGAYNDVPRCIEMVSDNRFLILGTGGTPNGLPSGDITAPKGDVDPWLIQIDSNGNLLNDYSYGGTDTDKAIAISKNSIGGYALFSQTESSDGDVSGHIGLADFWVALLDANFNLLAEKCFGSVYTEIMTHGIAASDGSILSLGYAASSSGDILNNFGWDDVWLLKIQSNVGVETLGAVHDFQIYPNPAYGQHTIRFSAVAHQEVTIALMDAQGRNLGTVYRGLSQEYNDIELSIIGLDNGIYFYEVQVGQNVQRVQFVKD